MNAIRNDNDGVSCSKWDSVCFVRLANTCQAVAAVHEYQASEEGLVALSFQDSKVSDESACVLLVQFCQPVIQPETVLTQLFGHLQNTHATHGEMCIMHAMCIISCVIMNDHELWQCIRSNDCAPELKCTCWVSF